MPTEPPYELDALAYDGGAIAMVAMDQRESLRAMLAERGRPDGPEAIAGFKAAVAQHLAPLASGFLLDDGYDVPVPSGLILAADCWIAGKRTTGDLL